MVQAKSAEVGFGLAYRTVQYPQMEDCAGSGKAKDHQIGERYHVTYLNAAGREVCHARSMLLQRLHEPKDCHAIDLIAAAQEV